MKSRISILLLLGCLTVSFVSAQEFGYPVQGEGWYYIKVMILNTSETRNHTWKITKVFVNDTQLRDFLVFQLDREVYDKKIHGDWPFELKIRLNWVGEKEYKIRVELMNTESDSSIILAQTTTSPAFRGYWDTDQSRMLPVKKGSIYYEKIAWIPFSFQKKKAMRSYIQKYFNMYKHPLSIAEIIETYPESPEGWLVPILTEPFEEGVEDALTGHPAGCKKKPFLHTIDKKGKEYLEQKRIRTKKWKLWR